MGSETQRFSAKPVHCTVIPVRFGAVSDPFSAVTGSNSRVRGTYFALKTSQEGSDQGLAFRYNDITRHRFLSFCTGDGSVEGTASALFLRSPARHVGHTCK